MTTIAVVKIAVVASRVVVLVCVFHGDDRCVVVMVRMPAIMVVIAAGDDRWSLLRR